MESQLVMFLYFGDINGIVFEFYAKGLRYNLPNKVNAGNISNINIIIDPILIIC